MSRTAPVFDTTRVRRYYDRHTPGFMALGTGGTAGVIHRAVWGPGVTTSEDAFHYVDDRIAEAIRSVQGLSSQAHVVDLGCGVGASLCYLAQRLDIRGSGVTVSPLQARLAAARIQDEGLTARVACIEASFEDLPPAVRDADVAYAIESFAHAAHPHRFFEQCARLVRTGGLLLICDDVRRPGIGPEANRTIDRFMRGWHLNSLLDAASIIALARATGFAHEHTTDLSSHLVPRSARDQMFDALLGWLPLGRTPLGPVLGGAALQKCLARGWTAYKLMTFRRHP